MPGPGDPAGPWFVFEIRYDAQSPTSMATIPTTLATKDLGTGLYPSAMPSLTPGKCEGDRAPLQQTTSILLGRFPPPNPTAYLSGSALPANIPFAAAILRAVLPHQAPFPAPLKGAIFVFRVRPTSAMRRGSGVGACARTAVDGA